MDDERPPSVDEAIEMLRNHCTCPCCRRAEDCGEALYAEIERLRLILSKENA